jgi:hypothetical protein
MDYQFAGDFSKAPLGPFTAANKKLVWNDPSSSITTDGDPDGQFYSLVADDRFSGGRAQRQLYPKGTFGTGSKLYYVRYPSPQTIANLEYFMCFEADFSFMTPNTAKVCVGKIGPQINWGEVGGPTAARGTRAMWIWNGGGSNYPNPKLCPAGQDQRSGAPLISPPVYGPRIVTEQIYKLRHQIQGGPNGFAKWWIDDVQVAEAQGNYMATPEDDVIFDFAFWHGGADANYAPEHDSYARCGGVRMWSGEAYWADTGNGGGTDNGGGTGPTPPAGGSTTITIEGVTYDVAGNLTLTARS